MSKIICDVCGTAYPETSDKCPICGSAKQIEGNTAPEPAAESEEQSVKAVTKGGHFSNTNVRKRNKGKKVTVAKKKKAEKPQKEEPEQKDEPKRGLFALVIVLLVAVILVLAYIVIQFVLPMYGIELSDLLSKPAPAVTTSAVENTTVPEETTVPEDTSVACTGLTVVGGDVVLDAVGRAWLLEVTVQPGNTTDVVTYVSGDENVATVSDQGRVTAVGPGKTVITITCGSVVKQVKVECPFGEETTVPEETTLPEETTEPVVTEEPTTEEPTTEEPEPSTEATEPPAEEFGLFKQDDVTLTYKGETFEFESGDIYLSEITWTSNNPAVATVENGEVTAVGPGTTTIYGEYNGRKDSCIIRCEIGETEEEPEEDEEEDENSEYPRLWPSEDVSIRLDESFELDYVNADGEWTDIEWSSDDEGVAVVSGNVVTGVGYGSATISGTYDGKEITCIVRVRSDLD